MKIIRNIHIPKKKLSIGLLGVTVLVAALCLPPASQKVGSFAAANLERKLPIYCVQTEEPKVSVSFDAAWGACIYRRNPLRFNLL
ncbi:MAG: hypothetical protein IKI92_00375, partial [Anaerotignum sp.]|nr:hypothetical protein [Anaerotignum sp.]